MTFGGYGGSGTISLAGHVESSARAPVDGEDTRATLPFYRWRIARSDDGTRMWLRGEDSIDCVDSGGKVLATIEATPSTQGVKVSRDFTQVLIITEKNLRPTSVERYEIPAPCSMKD